MPSLPSCHPLQVWGLLFNAMMGRTGVFNLPALGRHLTQNEIRAELGGKVVHPYRSLTLPNVLKIKILAARKLQDFPNLQPRCEVQVRTIRGQAHPFADCRRIAGWLQTDCRPIAD